jgi:hypothetical protein
MSKHEEVAELLSQRIRHGDYLSMELPTEMTLAAETGVSRMTARKAIQNLIRRGLLARKDNGRVVCGDKARSSAPITAAFLAPAWHSSGIQIWRSELARIAARHHISLRPSDYVHWDDPSIIQTLDGFDAVFLVPMSSNISDMTLQRLKTHPKLAVIGEDFSHLGLLSINPFPPGHIIPLLNILKSKGCGRVDCVCPQHLNDTIDARIRQWRMWLRLNSMEGKLLGGDFKPYSRQLENAYGLVSDFLERDSGIPDALFCVTGPGALGAMRACIDKGLEVGRDIHVCAVNGEGLNRFVFPSLTCLEAQDMSAYLSEIIEWMKSDGVKWDGPMLLQAGEPRIFEGESTGALAGRPRTLSFSGQNRFLSKEPDTNTHR